MRERPVEEERLRRLLAERPLRSLHDRGDEAHLRRLAEVLTTVSTPCRTGELPGEEAALAAFRAARTEGCPGGAPADGRQPVPQPRLGGRARTTALGVAAAALLGGGVAVATGAGPFPGVGSLPGVGGGVERPEEPSTAGPPSGTASPRTTGPGAPDGRRSPGAHDVSPARLTALCRQFAERPGDGPGKSATSGLTRAELGILAEAAGGPDRIGDFCEARLASAARGRGNEGGAPEGDGAAGNGPVGNGSGPKGGGKDGNGQEGKGQDGNGQDGGAPGERAPAGRTPGGAGPDGDGRGDGAPGGQGPGGNGKGTGGNGTGGKGSGGAAAGNKQQAGKADRPAAPGGDRTDRRRNDGGDGAGAPQRDAGTQQSGGTGERQSGGTGDRQGGGARP